MNLKQGQRLVTKSARSRHYKKSLCQEKCRFADKMKTKTKA